MLEPRSIERLDYENDNSDADISAISPLFSGYAHGPTLVSTISESESNAHNTLKHENFIPIIFDPCIRNIAYDDMINHDKDILWKSTTDSIKPNFGTTTENKGALEMEATPRFSVKVHKGEKTRTLGDMTRLDTKTLSERYLDRIT